MRRLLFLLCACALICNTGCLIREYITEAAGSAAGSAANSAGSSAGNAIGNEAGNRAGNAAVNSMGGPSQPVSQNPRLAGMTQQMNQQVMMFYTQFIFSMAFGSGGYSIGTGDFKPGQYARFNFPKGQGGDDGGGTMERAYLGDDGEGNQWWKVKMVNSKKGETIILEALLSPKDNKMLRLRGKFPQDDAGKEMAVSENASYVPPTRLSKKSIEGATTGVESVTVPAGTFQARHVVFGDVGTTHEWWLADSVPGGTVKELTKASNNSGGHGMYELDLVASGSDAATELGTKLK